VNFSIELPFRSYSGQSVQALVETEVRSPNGYFPDNLENEIRGIILDRATCCSTMSGLTNILSSGGGIMLRGSVVWVQGETIFKEKEREKIEEPEPTSIKELVRIATKM